MALPVWILDKFEPFQLFDFFCRRQSRYGFEELFVVWVRAEAAFETYRLEL